MTVKCAGCGLDLESEVSEEEAAAEERKTDPTIGWVKFLCQLCQELFCLEHPEWVIEPKSEQPPGA